MQEHAAALVIDGELVGAVEEEKLARDRHYGWRAPDRPPFVTPTVDPTICIEEVLCRRSIRWLLAEHGLTLDDVDLIAINGLHGRFRQAFSLLDAERALPTLRAGRVVYVPHHLAHAASAYRLSGHDGGWVFTMDGRGDRETAAIFEVVEHELVPRVTVLSLTDRSIGGVYEGVTRVLGFGSHGQGSLMALAGFGEATEDFRGVLEVTTCGEVHVHESAVDDRFESVRRAFDEPMRREHFNLAASVQAALEQSAVHLLGSATEGRRVDQLALAGGVALNCQMNDQLRRTFDVASVFAQPGANDGGTAVGAAAEALWRFGEVPRLTPLRTESLGPHYDDATIKEVLDQHGVPHERVDDVPQAVADRIANGQVVAWFQGALEFGPRALGTRSLVADPRSAEVKDRLNAIKQRQDWRPFGPSVLAGHEGDWFEAPLDSPFMLFTLRVKAAQRQRIPAVMHVDGSTRPQVVHADVLPAYHAMITAFYERTHVPMVVNTSFNRRGEAIVCSPEDALAAFWGLRADALAIGSFIVEHPAPLLIGRPAHPIGPLQKPRRTRHEPAAILHSSDQLRHDRIAGTPGAYRRTLNDIASANARGFGQTVRVAVADQSRKDLAGLVLIAAEFGAELVFALAPPREHHHGITRNGWVSAESAIGSLKPALRLAAKRDVAVRLEGFPLCALPLAVRVLQRRSEERLMAHAPLPCRRCALLDGCPTIPQSILEIFGTRWLRPV